MSRRRTAMLAAACLLTLLLVAALAHWRLVFRGLILADYDAFVYFYANREYTASRLLEGQLPFWNPYLFAGTPHLANPQSAVFYPGTWLFLLLPTPYAYTANLVLHTALAGIMMFALVRRAFGGTLLGAMVAGTCFMLSGPISAQGGHINQLSAAALLPAVLLALHQAVRYSRVRWALAAAVFLCLQLLAGHPQVTYLTLVLGGLMLIWEMASVEPARWIGQIGLVVLAGVLAVGLAAIQLAPTLEATRLGIRSGGLSIGEASASSLPPELLPLSLLPGYSENPPSTEFLGFVGVAGLTLAVVSVLSTMQGRLSWLVVAAALSLALALGSHSAVFEALFGRLPGLDSFRVPARWLLPWCVVMSILAGLSLGRTSQASGLRRVLVVLVSLLPVTLAIYAAGLPEVASVYPVPMTTVPVWIGLAIATGLLWLLRARVATRSLSTVLLLLVVGEMLYVQQELPFSHAVPSVVWKRDSETVRALSDLDPGYRMLSIGGDGYQPQSTASLREAYPWLADYAFSLFLTAFKWADVQAPNVPSVYRIRSIDGYDGGVLPLSRFVLVSSLLHPLGDVRPDGVLKSSLDAIPRTSALDLFGVKAIVTSFEKDVEINGVGFDRAVSRTIAGGESIELGGMPKWPVQRAAILIGWDDGSVRDGDPLLEIMADSPDGARAVIPLAAGHDIPALGEVAAGRRAGRLIQPWRESSGLGANILVEVPLAGRALDGIKIANVSTQTTVTIGSITLLGSELNEQHALVLDPSLTKRDLGDSRLYWRESGLPRAFLMHSAEIMTDDDAIVRMFDSTWSPAQSVLLAPGDPPDLQSASAPERVTLTLSQPEEVRISVEAASSGLLVLSDPWYPGWFAWIDGEPAPIRRANIHFRAIEVAGGHHDIRFVYDPASMKLGAAVSAATLLTLGALAVLGQRLLRPLL